MAGEVASAPAHPPYRVSASATILIPLETRTPARRRLRMAKNIEIKGKLVSVEGVRRTVESMASGPPQFLQQVDTFFHVPKGRLKVRSFPDGSGELIAYHRPDRTGPKESAYTKISHPKADTLLEALATVLPVRGTVRKGREVFLVGRTRVHIDQVENLGWFLELEVVMAPGDSQEEGIEEAQQLLETLQVGEEFLLAEAYIDLLEEREEQGGSEPRTPG